MKQEIKSALYFLSGALVGAGSVWYFVNKHYREVAAKEIEQMQKVIDERYHPGKTVGRLGVTEESKAVVEHAYKSHVNAEKELIQSYRESIPANGTVYNTIQGSVTMTDDTKEESKETLEEDMPEEDEEREPYLITVEEYGDIAPYYDKIALVYDKSDSILADAQTSELMDVVETIGLAVYERLDKFKDGAYVYVRNDKISTDYEIEVRDFGDGEI